MCFEVKESFDSRQKARDYKPKIATEDIVVYKVLGLDNNRFFSPFQSFEYKRGKTYKRNKIPKSIRFWWKYYPENKRIWIVEINRGFHFCKTVHEAKEYMDYLIGIFVVVKMIVPKGSEYYENDQEIVSNQVYFPLESK